MKSGEDFRSRIIPKAEHAEGQNDGQFAERCLEVFAGLKHSREAVEAIEAAQQANDKFTFALEDAGRNPLEERVKELTGLFRAIESQRTVLRSMVHGQVFLSAAKTQDRVNELYSALDVFLKNEDVRTTEEMQKEIERLSKRSES